MQDVSAADLSGQAIVGHAGGVSAHVRGDEMFAKPG